MLKRVNVHLDDADLKQLDVILKKLQVLKGGLWGLCYANRAKLIRYAIANTYGLEYTDRWPSGDTLKKALKKALKKVSQPAKA